MRQNGARSSNDPTRTAFALTQHRKIDSRSNDSHKSRIEDASWIREI
jgi:hypothetical protein